MSQSLDEDSKGSEEGAKRSWSSDVKDGIADGTVSKKLPKINDDCVVCEKEVNVLNFEDGSEVGSWYEEEENKMEDIVNFPGATPRVEIPYSDSIPFRTQDSMGDKGSVLFCKHHLVHDRTGDESAAKRDSESYTKNALPDEWIYNTECTKCRTLHSCTSRIRSCRKSSRTEQ